VTSRYQRRELKTKSYMTLGYLPVKGMAKKAIKVVIATAIS
jgi:hypothetical protein|tara:strand:+ start:291 stop:413 length:123 start_codon:yes stop_codon:yes gene_type:complete